MKLKWLGTAGFRVEAGDQVFLIDPYFSRHPRARPAQDMKPADAADADRIFITHGHFDHLQDIPEIMALGTASVYCSETAAATLAKKGVDSSRIFAVKEDGYTADQGGYKAQAFFSRHVKFDIPLVARTMTRMSAGDYRFFFGMSRDYPAGQVLSWRFTFNGYSVHHFGSPGSTREELERLAALPLDVLMVPLQGHTHICDIALEYVRLLKPKLFIPHHQDDFYPPISDTADVAPFVRKVRRDYPATDVKVLEVNETLTLSSQRG